MNILASYNWIKEYLKTDLSAEEFAKLTTSAGNSVETISDLSKKFNRMVVGLITKVESHPDADKLRIVKTDIGKKKVDIVCGGENLEEGMLVVVGLPGAKVLWHGEGDLVELEKTKIRGVESHGMICAASEIGFDKLEQSEKDIWDITKITESKPGTPISEALGLDDFIFDIEVTTNRPDCKSIIGQAREGGAVTSGKFNFSKQVSKSENTNVHTKKGIKEFVVDVKEKELCPKYSAVLIGGIKVGPSPWWLQKKLLLAGFKPINNLVDITNYVLHEYGQPMHTFDADKLNGDKVVVRKAKKSEKFVALDGSEHKLDSSVLVIADSKRPIAIAGVMGGESTGTTDITTSVLIECATFDPVSVRRTSRALNLYSDSQLLFEKGLSTEATEPALMRAISLILEIAGGKIISDIITHKTSDYKSLVFDFDEDSVNSLMGIDMSKKAMVTSLEKLGFMVSKSNKVTVPYWRDNDIESSVDFVEEIARIYGYDNFPAKLPSSGLNFLKEDPGLVWERKIKDLLAGSGLTEVYSFAFVSKDQLDNYGISEQNVVKIKNPLTIDQEYMRPSLVPSMLTAISKNNKRFPVGGLFEVAPVYKNRKNDRPKEPLQLVLGVYGGDGKGSFLKAKGILERLFGQVGIHNYEYKRDTDPQIWHAGRSVSIHVDGRFVGEMGQVSRFVERAFGLDVSAVIIRLEIAEMLDLFTNIKFYKAIAQFPSVKRDIAFVIDERIEYGAVIEKIMSDARLLESVDVFDIYRGKGVDEDKKSLALHLSFSSSERTLNAKEVDDELELLRTMLQKEFNAIMRS